AGSRPAAGPVRSRRRAPRRGRGFGACRHCATVRTPVRDPPPRPGRGRPAWRAYSEGAGGPLRPPLGVDRTIPVVQNLTMLAADVDLLHNPVVALTLIMVSAAGVITMLIKRAT